MGMCHYGTFLLSITQRDLDFYSWRAMLMGDILTYSV